jgi:hypothetical protein
VPADLRPTGRGRAPVTDAPLLGPPPTLPVRTYVGVGVNTKGKRGRFSRRVPVSLAAPPSPPSSPTITFTEKSITVTWTPAASGVPGGGNAAQPDQEHEPDRLTSRTLAAPSPAVSYNVYDATTGALLTSTPIAEARYTDARIEWGAERCYSIRAVDRSGGLSVESEAPETRCVKLVDRFPPAAPRELKAVSTEGVISLIWDANTESDLAGYLVLRGRVPGDRLEPLISTPVLETSFNDTVPAGARYVYEVQAVDKAGNISGPSNRVEETAR